MAQDLLARQAEWLPYRPDIWDRMAHRMYFPSPARHGYFSTWVWTELHRRLAPDVAALEMRAEIDRWFETGDEPIDLDRWPDDTTYAFADILNPSQDPVFLRKRLPPEERQEHVRQWRKSFSEWTSVDSAGQHESEAESGPGG